MNGEPRTPSLDEVRALAFAHLSGQANAGGDFSPFTPSAFASLTPAANDMMSQLGFPATNSATPSSTSVTPTSAPLTQQQLLQHQLLQQQQLQQQQQQQQQQQFSGLQSATPSDFQGMINMLGSGIISTNPTPPAYAQGVTTGNATAPEFVPHIPNSQTVPPFQQMQQQMPAAVSQEPQAAAAGMPGVLSGMPNGLQALGAGMPSGLSEQTDANGQKVDVYQKWALMLQDQVEQIQIQRAQSVQVCLKLQAENMHLKELLREENPSRYSQVVSNSALMNQMDQLNQKPPGS